MSIIISIEDLTKCYKKNEMVLKHISFDIEEKIFLTIVGHSGSGKSTLLNIVSGLLKPTTGNVFFKGENIVKYSDSELANLRRSDIGQVFQDYQLLSHLTVEENIKLGLNPKGNSFDFDRIVEVLGIQNLTKSFPNELSGGEQQRVSIARAIIKKPSVIFCDEATGALDEENSKTVISLLHSIKKEFNITVIFITHNKEIAKTADRIITVKNGTVFSDVYNLNPIKVREMKWI